MSKCSAYRLSIMLLDKLTVYFNKTALKLEFKFMKGSDDVIYLEDISL